MVFISGPVVLSSKIPSTQQHFKDGTDWLLSYTLGNLSTFFNILNNMRNVLKKMALPKHANASPRSHNL